MFAGERNDRSVGALALQQVTTDRPVILNGPLDPGGDDHGPRLAADLVQCQHLLVEMIDHDLGFQPDRMVVALDIMAQLLGRALGIELRVGINGLDQPVVTVDRRVVAQHVQDEPLLDRLLHRVTVKRPMLDPVVFGTGFAEHFQRLRLWRRGEGKIAGVGEHFSPLHNRIDLVFDGFVVVAILRTGQCGVQCGSGLTALA